MLTITAYLTMFIDHFAKFVGINGEKFNPVLGRIAFPIFAYLIAKGLKRTKSKEKYIYRIFIFALISQIPYILMIYGLPQFKETMNLEAKIQFTLLHFIQSFNVGFTFLIATVSIYIFEKNKNNILNQILIIALAGLIAYDLNVDYQYLGVYMVYIFYLVTNKVGITILISLLTLIYTILNAAEQTKLTYIERFQNASFQFYSLLALPIIFWVKEPKINKDKKNQNRVIRIVKYLIYPIHMLIIFLINMV